MKRPEGFDRGEPSTPTPSRRAAPAPRAKAPRTPAPRIAEPKAQAPRTPAPRIPAPQTAAPQTPAPQTRAPRIGASRPRSARAEFAAADRQRRREERAEVRRFTRRSRRRVLGWLTAAGLVVLLVAFVLIAVFSPLLALRKITVDGAVRLDPAQVEKAVDGQLGTPLALLDDDRMRTELSKFTLIRSYSTEVVPPGTLLIHIVERSSIGVVQAPEGFQLVDPAGVVIDTVPQRPTGVPLIQLDGNDTVKGAGFRSMAEVLLALPNSVLTQVDTIGAHTRDDVTLTLSGTGQRVIWGSADSSDKKARNLAQLLQLYADKGPGEYDVSAPELPVWHAG